MPVKGALLGSALLLSQAVAFSPPACLPGVSGSAPRSCDTVRYASKGRSVANEPLGGVRSQMDKIEASAVQRMTKGYDKLCKNCPTRLQPRVDTLTEVLRSGALLVCCSPVWFVPCMLTRHFRLVLTR
jgi:hypothetical protein